MTAVTVLTFQTLPSLCCRQGSLRAAGSRARVLLHPSHQRPATDDALPRPRPRRHEGHSQGASGRWRRWFGIVMLLRVGEGGISVGGDGIANVFWGYVKMVFW